MAESAEEPLGNAPAPRASGSPLTIREVAAAAGVSVSTVSRVMNAAPNIPAATVEAVRRAIVETNYKPLRRRRTPDRAGTVVPAMPRIGFYIIEHNAFTTNPAYELLFRGVTKACEALNLELQLGFLDTHDVVQRLAGGRFDGLILHGTPPDPEMGTGLHEIPTVWLMGGRRRPQWGDQVMPDNHSIGQIAANYLLGRGIRHCLYYGFDSGWSLHMRGAAFRKAVADAGASVTVLEMPMGGPDGNTLPEREFATRDLIKHCRSSPKPLGLFIGEDWLAPPVYAAAAEAGLVIGTDLVVISCNNDLPRLEGLSPKPATIDIHLEQIAYGGVELLVFRLKRATALQDRLRIAVEPHLVLP